MNTTSKNTDPLYFFGHSLTGEISRSIDWSKSTLGRAEDWGDDLKVILAMMFNNRHPVGLLWGDDRIWFYNDAYIPIVGETKHPEAMGEKGKIVWAEIWSLISPQFDHVMNKGEAIWMEDNYIPIIGKGNVLRDAYFTYSYSPVYKADGTIGGVLVTCAETTKRIQAERSSNEASKEIVSILDGMNEGFFAIDKNWIVTRVNPQFENIIKMKRDDVIGKSLLDLYFHTPEQLESLYVKTYSKVLKERVAAHFVDYYAAFDIWTSVSVYPKPDGGIAVFFREISEERRKEQELKNAVITRDDFLSLASHELKTPLTSLKLQSQMLKRQIDKNEPSIISREKIVHFSEQTENHISRLIRLIDDMLDISRIRSGKLTIVKDEVNLCDLIKDVLKRMESQFTSKKYELPTITDCPKAVGLWDSLRIEQAVMNLLTNAIRYGEGRPVTLKVESMDDKVRLYVKDNGIGIAKENHKNIFNKFHRVTSLNQINGLGLGLFLTTQIAEAHGGKIWVESEIGKGAVFCFELPKIYNNSSEVL